MMEGLSRINVYWPKGEAETYTFHPPLIAKPSAEVLWMARRKRHVVRVYYGKRGWQCRASKGVEVDLMVMEE